MLLFAQKCVILRFVAFSNINNQSTWFCVFKRFASICEAKISGGEYDWHISVAEGNMDLAT